MNEKIQDFTMTYQVKNENRKWYQIWKPLTINKEVTIHDAEITIGKENIKNGVISYNISVDTKELSRKVAHKIIDEEM